MKKEDALEWIGPMAVILMFVCGFLGIDSCIKADRVIHKRTVQENCKILCETVQGGTVVPTENRWCVCEYSAGHRRRLIEHL